MIVMVVMMLPSNVSCNLLVRRTGLKRGTTAIAESACLRIFSATGYALSCARSSLDRNHGLFRLTFVGHLLNGLKCRGYGFLAQIGAAHLRLDLVEKFIHGVMGRVAVRCRWNICRTSFL